MKSYTRSLVASLAMMAALPFQPAIAATPADTLIIARNLTDHFSIDPAEAFEVSNGDIVNNLYTRIIARDPDNYFKLVPGVAESWELGPGGLTARLKIRKDLKFHSGRPVTAEDAAFSLQRVVQLRKSAAYIIRQFGWNETNVKERVRAEGDTLVLTLDKPYAPDLLFNALTAIVASVVDKTEVLAHEQNGDLGNGWLRTRSAGSGAFRISSYIAKELAVLEANPAFHRGAPGLKRVVIRNVPESAAQQLLIEKGDADIARNLTPDQLEVVKKNPNVVVQDNAKGTVLYLAFNIKRSPLDKPEVWEALRWLIDYEAIANRLLKGDFKVRQTFLAEGLLGSLNEQPYRLDPEKARALLAKAGLPNGFEVTLEIRSATPYAEVGEALQSSFALGGVKLNLVRGDPLQILTRYRERRHDLALSIKSLDYADPNSTAEFFTRNDDDSDTASNRNGAWRNHWYIPELTKRTSDAVVEQDVEKRAVIYQELQREVLHNSPIIFLLQEVEQNAVRKNITGFRSGAAWDSALYDLVKKN